MRLYTWKDVERRLLLAKDKWEKEIAHIDVYPQELQIYAKIADEKRIYDLIGGLLGRKIHDNGFVLDFSEERVAIQIEKVEEDSDHFPGRKVLPLFADVLYQTEPPFKQDDFSPKLGGVPVFAFHSYKGGVGRTLSLLSFAKAWTEIEGKDKTLLIIDGDIEAPGLTWLYKEDQMDETFSYLDLLVLAQQSGDAKELASKVKKNIQFGLLSYESEERSFSQFFLPTYRYEQQLLDIYAAPQTIAQGYKKSFFLAELFSQIGKELGVEAVLLDLRAGLSDFSAPFLFDPRIKKYVVSSTSYQSRVGTKLLLKQMLKGFQIEEDTIVPEVFVTMVRMNEDTEKIHDQLREPFEDHVSNEHVDLLDNIIHDLNYADDLVRLERLQDIMSTFDSTGKRFHEKILDVAKDSYESLQEKMQGQLDVDLSIESQREAIIREIHAVAEEQLTTEGNRQFAIMKTAAVMQLADRFSDTKPVAVVIGPKGSGKTYLYREILRRGTWEQFVCDINGKKGKEETVVVPLLATRSIAKMSDLLTEGVRNFAKIFSEHEIENNFYQSNRNKLTEMLAEEHSEKEWVCCWKSLMMPSQKDAQPEDPLLKINRFLSEKQKRILFLVDGLEEVFTDTLHSENERVAIAALCNGVISELQVNYDHISCLVFTRKDIIQNVFTTNLEQFMAQYKKLELQWSRTEALRMALWLVKQAVPSFLDDRINVEKASENVIRKELERLWGAKLGKPGSNEAYSSNWIIAALSDFNGQLQARDIIRFLKCATEDIGKATYEDRYIMPKEVRGAIPKCSEQKIEEIEQEIQTLKPIFQKMKEAESSKKHLPFDAQDIGLNKEDEVIMIREGYLYNDGGKYYLPEIIRHALSFTYEKGARPRVLALMARSGRG